MNAPVDVTWLAEHVDRGQVAFRIGRSGQELVAEWVGLAVLRARSDGTEVSFEPSPTAPAIEIEKIRNGSVVLLLRDLAGKLALHGAAVASRGRAVVLVGRAGQGKSTLAAALCGSGRAQLLADDAVALDPDATGGWIVTPTERQHWLDATAHHAFGDSDASAWRGKWPLAARSVATESVRLAAIVELAYGSDRTAVRLARTAGIEALASLVPQAVRFVLDDAERHKRELTVLSALVQQVPTYRLERPRDLGALDLSVQTIQTSLLEPTDDRSDP